MARGWWRRWRGRPGAAGWLLLLLLLPALFAHLVAWDEPILCRVNGCWHAPAPAALLGLPAPGPFGRAGARAEEILAGDPQAVALWPLFRAGPRRTEGKGLAPPSRRHPLGTDSAGRDLFALVLHGARISLAVALLSGAAALLLALPLGALAGYAGGITDQVVSRVAEVFAAFPSFFLVLAVMSWHGPGLLPLGLLLGVTRWTAIFRYVRAEFMRLKEREFVLAARALGVGPLRIMAGEILPNAWGAVLVPLAFLLSGSVLYEAGLSWIGLGVASTTPSWGHLLKDAHHALFHAPHLLYPPAAAIFLMTLAWNAQGEALRRRLGRG